MKNLTGATFPCGKDGHITGTVIRGGKRGCTYVLDKDVKGYKKIRRFPLDSLAYDTTVVEMTIPAGTKIRAPWKRNSVAATVYGVFNHCRAEYAIVGELPKTHRYCSIHDKNFVYDSGKKVQPKGPFSVEPDVECGNGIYFFFDRKFAEQWTM